MNHLSYNNSRHHRNFSLYLSCHAVKSRVLETLIRQLGAATDLSAGQIQLAVELLTDENISAPIKADFLTALATKGETAGEIAAFAAALREKSVPPPLDVRTRDREILDIVGTGGDRLSTFNISTTAAILCAAAGVTVAKHGNRAVTSSVGSADVIEALGIKVNLSPADAARELEEKNFAFFFAPNFHPAFKHVAAARNLCAGRGQRTIFNILGPLINPGRPAHLLLGVFAEAWVDTLATALDSLGTQAGLAAHGVIAPGRGIDELTTATMNRVQGFGRLRDTREEWRASDFGLAPAPFEDLVGGDLMANLTIVDALLAGRGPAGLVDTIVLNTAVALWIVGRTASVREGVPLARELLIGGAVKRKIEATREFYHS